MSSGMPAHCPQIITVIAILVLTAVRGQRCPTDDQSGPCVEICRNGVPTSNGSTTQCRTPSRDAYRLSAARRSGREGATIKLSLPACKNISLTTGQFSILRNGDLQVNLGNAPQRLSRYVLSSDNTTANVCYPLSPQLLQCTLKQLDTDRYTLADNGSLVDLVTSDVIDLRDYYLHHGTVQGAESDHYIGCTKRISATRRLRCNYVVYHSDEYRFESDHMTIRLLPTNDTLYRPEYTELNNGTINLCYPSSPEFTWCVLWWLEKHEFQILDDHQLYEIHREAVHHMSNYLIQKGRALTCVAQKVETPKFDMPSVMAILQLVSAVLLLVAFVIHLLIPSLNYHAKPLLCHMVSMVIMYVCIACRKFLWIGQPVGCYTLFVFMYLFSAASFFWLNVLAFDLWCIFGNLQTSSASLCCPPCGGATGAGRSNKHRFYYYSVYAWGCPIILLTFILLIDAYESLQDALQVYPYLGRMCWFNDWKSALLLIHVPLFFVIGCNLLLFVLTVVNLRRASKGVEIVNKKLNTQLLFVCFKIFIVMGLSWISEAIAHAVNTHGTVTYVPDIINATQGITIFAIYICKPATYRLLRKRFCRKSHSDGEPCIRCLRIMSCEFLLGTAMDEEAKSTPTMCVRFSTVTKMTSARNGCPTNGCQ